MQRPSVKRVALALLLLSIPPAQAEIVMRQDVIGSGGSKADAASYSIIGTLGQPSVGVMVGSQYDSEGGFWYPRNQIACADWANHNVGDCILTVTNRGILGFLDDSQTEGSGFVYPLSDPQNRLFIGSLWVGESESYIANRDYALDPAQEWTESIEPDGHTWINYSGSSHQDIHASYTDSTAAQPRGLFVEQESWAFAYNSVATDFVIMIYRIRNLSGSSLIDLYAGVFLDVDIEQYAQNTGSTDGSRNLVYITDPSDIHVGATMLEGGAAGAPLSNLTLIHNPTYVWPNVYVLDSDKYGFLAVTGPSYSVPDAPDPDDYSLLVSAGPFDLDPDEECTLAFAILGGESLDELEQHADVAQLVYVSDFADVAEGDRLPVETRLMPCAPNPFAAQTLVRFSLAKAADVHLGIYDVNGRLVRCMAKGEHPAMHFALSWDGRDETGNRAPAGVYFLRLAAGEQRHCRRLIRVR
jgi:hypothetical protein